VARAAVSAHGGTPGNLKGLFLSNREFAMEKHSTGQVVETGRESRQGYLDRPVLMVLLTSTVLTLVVLGVLWALYT
jgi:hypothetical protein